jgi:hypothetical protein
MLDHAFHAVSRPHTLAQVEFKIVRTHGPGVWYARPGAAASLHASRYAAMIADGQTGRMGESLKFTGTAVRRLSSTHGWDTTER